MASFSAGRCLPWAARRTPSHEALPAHEAASAWSIDDEPTDSSWHDSSWTLRKGLQVIEGAPADALPPEWRLLAGQ